MLVISVMTSKLGMHLYVRFVARRAGSTALMASAADHRNDVLVSAAVLTGVVLSNLGFPLFDPAVAIPMGEAPPPELVERIMHTAKSIHGVLGLNDVLAHYVGTTVEIEVHINVQSRITIEEAHGIGKKVQ